jgi:hypothetical protein
MGRSWKRAQPQEQAPRQFLTRQLLFKWIKQNLRIKHFYGCERRSESVQIWIAVCVYTLAAILKKDLMLKIPLYTFLQILSVHSLEKSSLHGLFMRSAITTHPGRPLIN